MIFLLIFGVGLVTAVLATPPVRKLAHRLGIVATPGGRRQHSGMIAKLGGVPIMLGYLVGIGLIYLLVPPEAGSHDALRLRGVLLGSVVIFLGAFLDDRLDLKPRWQFAFQIVAAVIAMSHIIFIERFTNPLPSAEFWQSGFASLFFSSGSREHCGDTAVSRHHHLAFLGAGDDQRRQFSGWAGWAGWRRWHHRRAHVCPAQLPAHRANACHAFSHRFGWRTDWLFSLQLCTRVNLFRHHRGMAVGLQPVHAFHFGSG